MEALRLKKLTLECAVLERANRVARGDLLPLQESLNAFDEHIGWCRYDLKGVSTPTQWLTCPWLTPKSTAMTSWSG